MGDRCQHIHDLAVVDRRQYGRMPKCVIVLSVFACERVLIPSASSAAIRHA